MGADGHWYLMRHDEFADAFPDVDPLAIGLSAVTVLGVKALAGYEDTEGRDLWDESKTHLVWEHFVTAGQIERVRREGTDGVLRVPAGSWSPPQTLIESDLVATLARIEADPEYPRQRRIDEAQRWFQKHAEDHMVWT